MYYNPIGVVALPQGRGFHKESFLNFVRECNMKCAVVLDDLPLCASLGVPYPIHRDFDFEPNPGKTPETALQAARDAVNYIVSKPGYDKVIWHINNEPDVSELRFNMYAFMMEEIARRKLSIRCVFGNFASGSVKCGQGSDPNDWLDKGEHFFGTLESHPQHFIGVHEYTSITPWYVSNGGEVPRGLAWKNRPTKIDWLLPQWHLGRNYQGIRKAVVKFEFGSSFPKIIVTEALIDRMNDVPEVRLDPSLNGYKTYKERWQLAFPEFQLGELYSEFLIWAWETIYAPTNHVGIATFCYGNTGNWQNYNVADDDDYVSNMKEYRYVPKEIEEIPVQPDLSEKYFAKLARLPSTSVNIRSAPNVFGLVLGQLSKGEVVSYFPKSVTNGWVYVRIDGVGIEGWVSLQNGEVEFKKEEPPVVKPTYTKWVIVKATYNPNTNDFQIKIVDEE